MGWRPKQKQLSPEEAIALARRELAPFWFGTLPLLAAVQTGDQATVYPLDPVFAENTWIIAFVRATDGTGENLIAFSREMNRRYHPHHVRTLLVIKPEFQFLLDPIPIEQFTRRFQINFPLAVDHDGLLAQAFRVRQLPAIRVMHGRSNVIEREGNQWFDHIEAELQKFLRSLDPGLALLPPFIPDKDYWDDQGRIDFGKERGTKFPAPGFVGEKPPIGTAVFQSGVASAPQGSVVISGRWTQDADRIFTSDPKAVIQFHCPTSGLALVAQSISSTRESSKVEVLVNDVPAYEAFSSEDLVFDEEGRSVIRAEGPRLYRALNGLPKDKRALTLRFPIADRVPIALFGIRFLDLARPPVAG